IVELESRLAFHEYTLQTLNDVVTRQQQQIEALIREIQALKDRLRAAAPSPVGPLEDEKPPPHY
ncbi:MAG: SlyX family protein, partial [Gammaproteobacteria bacterium]